MEEAKINPNQEIYEELIKSLYESKENEHAYYYYEKMIALKLSTSTELIHKVITNLIADSEELVAFHVIMQSHKKDLLLQPHTYLMMMRAAARKYMDEAVVHTWKKCVDVYQVNIFEGDCLLVLGSAARNGNPSLAADALRIIDQKGYEMKEHHLEPLLESFMVAENWVRMFETLHLMRSSGMGLSKETLLLLSNKLSKSISTPRCSPQVVFDTLMEKKNEYSLAVDVVTINALLRGYTLAKETKTAIECSHTWFEQLQIKKNSDTFSILLDGCLIQKNTFAAKNLFESMTTEGIEPNQQAYESMVLIYLTQPDYENAFLYLEAMKSKGFIPSGRVYSNLVIKCEKHGDPRYEAVIDEMKLFGYPIMFGYNRYMESIYKISTESPPDE
ncbi:hypothetical protein BB559_006117 [Furculomyces boomerangus]|uniref:Pentatricopeptide repeat-containing protein-mitochondrial domain-containing protein n=2 Tax=Harpellales TaxID=61421 RepID=A0A2T9Y4U9_9FUNG|nr:hypothetical protein BB559_006396 [Furculomyces boomerangus]PVU87294.1 hypothetical protein BB559_006117 [Furculomyces boomerangus]PVZ96628.1 hypothetical protein BB558_007450 [Smittium angustum]